MERTGQYRTVKATIRQWTLGVRTRPAHCVHHAVNPADSNWITVDKDFHNLTLGHFIRGQNLMETILKQRLLSR
jgi:hypothetical protein